MSVLDQLLSMRAQLDTMIASASGGADLKTLSKTKSKKVAAEKAEKKPRANAGVGTAWSTFSSKIQKDHAEELAAVKADAAARRAAAKEAGEEAPADCVGAHLHWCSRYKAEHEEEWLAFKASWEAEHPKTSAAASEAGSVAGDAASADGASEEAPKKKRGAKKDSELSPDELAAKKAARAAKKAAKAAAKEADEGAARAASVMAPPAVEEAAAPEEAEEDGPANGLCPFRHKKVNYLRFGHKDAEGDYVWHEDGDLWLALADGSKGAYAGQLQADGSINTSAEVMAAGEQIEID